MVLRIVCLFWKQTKLLRKTPEKNAYIHMTAAFEGVSLIAQDHGETWLTKVKCFSCPFYCHQVKLKALKALNDLAPVQVSPAFRVLFYELPSGANCPVQIKYSQLPVPL